jgi:ABC-type nickel/cobalt efflux system permease component RcnA
MLGGSFLLCALLLLAAIWTTDLALSKLALRWSMSLFNALYRCFNRIFIFCLACLNCWKNLYLVLKQKILARRHSETQIEHLIANDLQDELPTLILDKAWLQHNDQHFQADVHLDNVEKKSRVESQIPSLAPPDVKTIILPQVEAYLELEVGATKRSGQESPLSSSLKTPQNSKHLNGIDTDANTKSHQPPHKTDAKLSISTIDVEVGDWDLSFELYDWERTTE